MKNIINFILITSVLTIIGYIFYKKNDVTGTLCEADVEYINPESVDFDIDVPICEEADE